MPLAIVLGPRFACVAALLAIVLLLEAIALVRVATRRSRPIDPFADLRKAVVVAGSTWIACLAFVQPYERAWAELAIGIGIGAFAALIVADERLATLPWSFRRAADVVCFSGCAALLLAEAGLRELAVRRPNPLLVRGAMEPSDILESNRCEPGELNLGFPCNARGHYDEPFARKLPGECRIATIGDSFSLGVVPHAYHYTTVCERALGCKVDNFGFPFLGLREYDHLLVEEVLPLDPDLVVIAMFVGNDLILPARHSALDRNLRAWFDRDQVLLALVPTRLAKIAAERRRLGDRSEVPAVQGADASQASLPEADLERRFPWLTRPELEEATMSSATFLDNEVVRARIACEDTAWYRSFESAGLDLVASARSTPLVVMLIPDEFQVEDGLWEQVLSLAPRARSSTASGRSV